MGARSVTAIVIQLTIELLMGIDLFLLGLILCLVALPLEAACWWRWRLSRMWGVFDEPLTDHDLLVLSRAFDFSDGLREHCVPAAWEALDSTLDSGVRELVSHPPRTEAELAAAIAGLGHAVARRAVDGALDRLQSRWL